MEENRDRHWNESTFYNEIQAILGETSGVYLFTVHLPSGEYTISPSLLQRFAFPKGEDAKQLSWEKHLYPADRQALASQIERLKKGEIETLDCDCRIVDGQGQRVWVSLHARIVQPPDSPDKLVIGSLNLIDLENRADTTTGLLNQRQFEADYAGGFPLGEKGYLVIFGADDFRAVNEQYGLHTGNQLLKLLAECLEKHLPPTTRVYRLDGDRFATVMADKNEMAIGTLYTLVKRDFALACSSLEDSLYCTISAGSAGYPYDSENFLELFQFAENALNTAKRRGKNNIVFFSREAYEEFVLQTGLREALQQSVQNNFEGFSVHYQPQISALTGTVAGAEALLRWQNPVYGRIPPDIFVPILEKTGLIGKVGRWILEAAMEQCRKWRCHVPDFTVSVNLSYQQFETDDIPGLVHTQLNRLQLPGQALTLELVESLQLRNFMRFNEITSYLNRMGVSMSIDDFGTGYSSLGYFKELNVHQIKIDRIFVSQMRNSIYDYELLHFIVYLAHEAGVTVCVEGVETAEELKALLPLRPDFYQGFFFGRPTDAAHFEQRFLLDWKDSGRVLREYQEAHPEESSKLDASQFIAHEETFLELLDELDEVVSISDRETYEMIYLNRAGRTLLGAQNYQDLHCHELLYNKQAPCDFCLKRPACRDHFVLREYYSDHLGKKFLVRHKLIPWKGKLANLGISVDLTKDDTTSEAGQKDALFNTLSGCVKILTQEADPQFALGLVLKSLGEYYGADRAYLFSFAPGTDNTVCTREWCRPGITPEKDAWQGEAYSGKRPVWYAELAEGKPIVSGQGPAFQARYPAEYGELCRYAKRWFILAPIFLKSELIGFAGVDNPEKHEDDPQLLSSLSIFLAQSFALTRTQEELFRTRFVDATTGLLNRECFQRDLAALTEKPPEQSLGVVRIEVESFKQIGRERGYRAGDLMMQRLAADIQAGFEGYNIYRLGLEEIVLLGLGVKEMGLKEACDSLQTACKAREGCTIRLAYAFSAMHIDPARMLETVYEKTHGEPPTNPAP